jgi:hypothetical protein
MTERLIAQIDRLAAEAGIKEVTPEIRKFAWAIRHTALIDFWKAAARQVEFQQEVMDKFLEE